MKLRRPVVSEEEAQATMVALRAVVGKRILVESDEDKLKGMLEALEQAPVFEGDKVVKDPDAVQLGAFARKSDTSRQAALANYPKTGSQRARILELLLRCEEGIGLTREELAAKLGLTDNSVRPRVVELLRGEWAQVLVGRGGESVTRRTALGNPSEVIVASARARSRAPRAPRRKVAA